MSDLDRALASAIDPVRFFRPVPQLGHPRVEHAAMTSRPAYFRVPIWNGYVNERGWVVERVIRVDGNIPTSGIWILEGSALGEGPDATILSWWYPRGRLLGLGFIDWPNHSVNNLRNALIAMSSPLSSDEE